MIDYNIFDIDVNKRLNKLQRTRFKILFKSKLFSTFPKQDIPKTIKLIEILLSNLASFQIDDSIQISLKYHSKQGFHHLKLRRNDALLQKVLKFLQDTQLITKLNPRTFEKSDKLYETITSTRYKLDYKSRLIFDFQNQILCTCCGMFKNVTEYSTRQQKCKSCRAKIIKTKRCNTSQPQIINKFQNPSPLFPKVYRKPAEDAAEDVYTPNVSIYPSNAKKSLPSKLYSLH